MATVTITNLTNREVYVKDLYDSLEPFEVMVIERSMGQLSGMLSLHQAVRDGILDVVYTMDSVEQYLSGENGGTVQSASNQGTGDGVYQEPIYNSSRSRPGPMSPLRLPVPRSQ
jgi:hypothetical protein